VAFGSIPRDALGVQRGFFNTLANSRNFPCTEFSEDEMRRPTPRIRSTLWVCKGYTGSLLLEAQLKGGSAHG
jgi:hypothetical protein